MDHCTYVYTIPGRCLWKLEFTEVDTATPVISACLWVPCQEAARLYCEHRRSAAEHKCHFRNAKPSLIGKGGEHDVPTLPFHLVQSENILYSLINAKDSLNGAGAEQPSSCVYRVAGQLLSMGPEGGWRSLDQWCLIHKHLGHWQGMVQYILYIVTLVQVVPM